MSPLHLVVQKEITRSADIAAAAEALGISLSTIDLQDWRDQVSRIDGVIADQGERPLVFCSLPVAGHILRACPTLARGVVLPKDFLRHSHYSSLVPENIQLNTGGIYLPWGRILDRAAPLSELYPEGVFIRPDSSLKPFTGFAVTIDALRDEHHMMTQAAGISDTELCLIAPAQALPAAEYRVWIVDSQPVTSASYGWDDNAENHEVPEAVIEAARRVGTLLEMSEQIFTADFVEMPSGVKLVELNAVSTSGWYKGMDPTALISALDPMFI